MIVRGEAIVLRSINYGETSQIVTLFTRERGKLTVMAKGARLPRSRFGSTLQPMSHIQLVYYYKPTRGVQTLTETSHLQLFNGIADSLQKVAVGVRIVELLSAYVQEEDRSPLLFNLAVRVLEALNAAPARATNVLPYFVLHLAAYLGFTPAFEREAVAALPEEGGVLSLDTGEVYPPNAVPVAARQGSRAALRAFSIFSRATLDVCMRLQLPQVVYDEALDLAETFLRHHTGEAYPTRSMKVIHQLLEAGSSSSLSAGVT